MSERVGILASGDRKSGGGGSTAERVIRDVLEQKVGFHVGVVICNNPEGIVGVHPKMDHLSDEFGLKGDERIPVVTINHDEYPQMAGDPERGLRLRESERYQRVLEQYGVDFVWMLGFMLIANGEIIEERGWKEKYTSWDRSTNGIYHPNATLGNNHPSILPWTADTHGPTAHAKAVELFKQGKITHTAMTYHLVEQGIDSGPIIYAEPIEMHEDQDSESVGDEVQATEKEITSKVIDRHLLLRRQHLFNLAS